MQAGMNADRHLVTGNTITEEYSTCLLRCIRWIIILFYILLTLVFYRNVCQSHVAIVEDLACDKRERL
jgi:hypothetical protein